MRSASRLPRRHDLAVCRATLRAGSQSFYAAALLLPRRVRDHASAIYAFCRAADDAVDRQAATPGTIAALQDRLGRIYAGRGLRDPVERALHAVVTRHRIPIDVFLGLLEGFGWEVEQRHYDTLADLRAYSVRVAGTVGLAMAHLMDRRDPVTLARAADLGVAMQLTNIARDVGEDARAGRLYLPRGWLREAGIDPDAWLRRPRFSPPLGDVVRRLLAEADRLYARAAPGIPRLPRRCRLAVRAARRIYADIGRVIARVRYDSVRHRAYTSRARKVHLAIRAALARDHAERAGEPAAAALPESAFLIAARPEQDGRGAVAGSPSGVHVRPTTPASSNRSRT